MTGTRDEHAQYVRRTVDQLVSLRKHRNLTITDIALRTAWSPTTVRKFESNMSNPTLMQVVTYTDAIGCDWTHAIRLELTSENAHGVSSGVVLRGGDSSDSS